MQKNRLVTVALVEDDPGTRERLALTIRNTSTLDLVHMSGTAVGATKWLETGRPDVLLVDLGLPDLSGIEVIRHCCLRSPATEVMVITMFGDEANMLKAFAAGARGYLLKDGSEEELARHVIDLHAGGSPMSPLIARQLVAHMSRGFDTGNSKPSTQDLGEALSIRESEILTLVARGYTYKEVAQLSDISVNTVLTHVRSIYSKLAVHSKTEAVFEARQMGLLDR